MGYHQFENKLSYWHTYQEQEVDAVLGDAEVAIEFKSTTEVQKRHLSGLKAFQQEHPEARLIIVSLDVAPRLFDDIEILPAVDFLRRLWAGEIYNPTFPF